MEKEHKNSSINDWMLVSMTGIGHARESYPQFALDIVIKSINSKVLDAKLRLSKEVLFLESDIMQLLSQHIPRGRVEVGITLELFRGLGHKSFDKESAEELVAALKDFAEEHPYVINEITLGDLLKAPHLWREEGVSPAEDSLKQAVNEQCIKALQDLMASKKREGLLLTKSLAQSIQLCKDLVKAIQEWSHKEVENRFRAMTERVEALFSSIEIDKNRMYQECALLVERSDFKEEIDRLAAHLEHFCHLCREPGLKGRKLDFLCQEMLRESSTLLTKASEHFVMTKAIDLKAEIERIREQTQNIE